MLKTETIVTGIELSREQKIHFLAVIDEYIGNATIERQKRKHLDAGVTLKEAGDLLTVLGLIENGKALEAKKVVTHLETAVREEIPADIYKELLQIQQ